jgi:hypothetical protein
MCSYTNLFEEAIDILIWTFKLIRVWYDILTRRGIAKQVEARLTRKIYVHFLMNI